MGFSSKTFFCASNIITSISILYATMSHKHHFFFFFFFFCFSSLKCLQCPLVTLLEESNELSDANSKRRRRRCMMMMNLGVSFFA